jgi:hypothetical protein
VPDCGVELHHVLPKRALAVQAEPSRGLDGLCANCKRQSDPHCAERPGIEMAGDKGRDRLVAVIQISCPVDGE